MTAELWGAEFKMIVTFEVAYVSLTKVLSFNHLIVPSSVSLFNSFNQSLIH